MLTVLLTVLKWIGIILLGILAFLLLAVILVLFVPIPYRVNMSFDKALPDQAFVEAKASWLLHLVRFRFYLAKNQRNVELKVLFFSLRRRRKEKEEEFDYEGELPYGELPETEFSDSEFSGEDTASPQEFPTEPASFQEPSDGSSDDFSGEADEKADVEKSSLSKKFRVIRRKFERLMDAPRKIRYQIRTFCDRIKSGRLHLKRQIRRLQDERTKKAVTELLEIVKKLLIHVLPKKFRMDLLIGFDDPSVTGELYGYYWSLFRLHRGKIVFTPDFEHDILQADGFMKGRVILYFVLIAYLKYKYNKDIRRLISIIRN